MPHTISLGVKPMGNTMTNATYLQTLDRLHLAPCSMATAAALGVSVRQCQRYAMGHPIPPMLRLLLAMYLRHGLI
jgi:hypothetical protein